MTRSASAGPHHDGNVGDLLDRDTRDPEESLDGHHLDMNRLIAGDGASVELHHLRRRLETLPVIEQSKGILIAHYGIDADTAFDVLHRLASDHNIKLRDISKAIVSAAASSRPTAGIRPSLVQLLSDLESGSDSAR